MKKELQLATTQFKKNDSLDRIPTEKLLKLHKQLYEKSKLAFLKTCTICYEISSIDSFCNCKILLNNGIEIEHINRLNLKDFIVIYENTEGSLTAFKDIIGLLNHKKEIAKVEEKNNPILTYSNKSLIQGTWFSDELEYTFSESKVSFQFKDRGAYKGSFIISNNIISLEYTRVSFEVVLNWQAKIESINENELVLIDNSNEIGKREFFKKKIESKQTAEEQTVEQTEIKFIKEIFLTILIYGLILFSSITVIVGTFFKNTFFRKILTWYISDEVSIEDKIFQGGFTITIIVLFFMLSLNHLGSSTKSEILIKSINSRKATHLHILIAFLLFAVVFWHFSVMLLTVLLAVLVLVFFRFIILKIKAKIKKR